MGSSCRIGLLLIELLWNRNLLVAGRSVSSNRLANSALRVQASSMAMGQAAGAAAALSASQEATPSQIQIAELRELLLQHQAIVPIPEVTEISEHRINAINQCN